MLLLHSQRTLGLECQDGGNELQNLIAEFTEVRDEVYSYQPFLPLVDEMDFQDG